MEPAPCSGTVLVFLLLSAMKTAPAPTTPNLRGTRPVLPARMCGNATNGSGKATPNGVFDQTRERPVRGLGARVAGGDR